MLTENPPLNSQIRAGKMSKYLLYAIGEIVLVVIGILIALQINNWNEQRKAKEKEHQALVEVMSDLELNIASLKGALHTEPFSIDHCLHSIDIILTNLEEKGTYHDSLAKHFSKLFHYPDVDIKSSGYESLTSMGMDIVTDDHLRSEIGKFYTYTVPSAQRASVETRDDFYNYMLFYLRNEFISERPKNNVARTRTPVDYERLKLNKPFIESLKGFEGVFQFFQRQASMTLSDCEKLKIEIETKLKDS
jgi:type II secretory pathway pseudopilin PulG